ncbi:MAG: DUF1015 domain-containing protein [Acidobacteria bacterium]|nr:DUF1015 domain-containing protein [Acidobacteriota bacterium]
MSAIYPFTALRPAPRAAAAVASVPYDVVNTEEARALAEGDPLSFLRVSRPEIELPPGTDPHADAVYDLATRNFTRLKELAPLVVEEVASFYVYRLQMGAHVQSGVAACFSIDEYDRDLIKKHEKTRPDKEDDRTRHMLAVGAQTGPVFLTYRASTAVDAAVTAAAQGEPLYDIVAPDGVRHQIWQVPPTMNQTFVDAFAALDSLYIADGHHRAASAARTRQSLAAKGAGEHDRVLAVAFPDNQVQVLPYNRVVRDLHGLTANEFLASLKRRLTVTAGGPAAPARKGDVAIYLAGGWHTLTLPSAAQSLDVDTLETTILEPVLGIDEVRTNKRIDFVGGIRGTSALEQLVNSGSFAVAFSMFPVSVEDLMRVSDAGGIMPPKSTWFEPKLRDGLLSHVI